MRETSSAELAARRWNQPPGYGVAPQPRRESRLVHPNTTDYRVWVPKPDACGEIAKLPDAIRSGPELQ